MRSFKYQDKGTAVHCLNPLVKLVWGGSTVLLSLIFNHPVYILLLLAAILCLTWVARVWRELTSMLRLSLWLAISIIAINALVSYHGAHILVEAPFKLPVMGIPKITVEAIVFGAVMALRLTVIISAFTLVNLTTHPDDIMAVLLKMKLPYKSALVASLSTRFIPCLVEDVERISDVHRARGLELDAGNWFMRLRSRGQITVPLLANSLDRAVQVAEAMESRAFGTGQGRTLFKDIKIRRWDVLTLGFVILPLAFGVFLRAWGYGNYQYYPTLEAISFGSPEGVLLSILALLLLAIAPLAALKRRLELD